MNKERDAAESEIVDEWLNMFLVSVFCQFDQISCEMQLWVSDPIGGCHKKEEERIIEVQL